MGKSVSRPVVGLVLLVAVASTLSPGQVRRPECGHDRWAVKTLTDKDRGRVDVSPVNATVSKLASIRIHEIPYPEDGRIEPEELHVYRVRAKLMEIRREKDSDIHIILADLDRLEIRMIAEIPAPECANGSGHEDAFRQARETVLSMRVETTIEVVGVGFFDYLHDAKGGAKNGIEIHPVLQLKAAPR
jgi:hypothetical protein